MELEAKELEVGDEVYCPDGLTRTVAETKYLYTGKGHVIRVKYIEPAPHFYENFAPKHMIQIIGERK